MDSLTNQAQIPILVGPTGVGKSEIAYRLALECDYEVISADAFQVYRGMAVGTAQPSLEYQKKIPHHLVGVREPSESWSAVQFARSAREIIDQAQNRGQRVLMVGGAGFYIRTLVNGLPPGAVPSPEVRSQVLEKVTALGLEKAYHWLMTRDEVAAKRIHARDLQRICRALEKTFEAPKDETPFQPLGTNRVFFLGLERSREKLDEILKKRTSQMWEGLLKESEYLLGLKLPPLHPALAAIGYHEAIAFLNQTLSRETALERIYRRTRQYAKRQWTWFKHQHDVDWMNLDLFSTMQNVVEKLKEKIGSR